MAVFHPPLPEDLHPLMNVFREVEPGVYEPIIPSRFSAGLIDGMRTQEEAIAAVTGVEASVVYRVPDWNDSSQAALIQQYDERTKALSDALKEKEASRIAHPAYGKITKLFSRLLEGLVESEIRGTKYL